MLKKIIFYISFIFLLLCAGCNNTAHPSVQTITVNPQPTKTMLYFSGTISPLQTYAIDAPDDGIITQRYFEYGETVQAGQLLLIIKSAQLEQDYQSALAEYLKAKKDYSNNQTQMRGDDLLKKSGIISEDDYLNDKSNSYDVQLAYTQALHKLQTILDKTNLTQTAILQLQLSDAAAVNQALSQQVNTIQIFAPAAGIALMPEKIQDSTISSADSDTALALGSSVKSGQVLMTVGDVHGITITFKVNESNINAIQIGQKALVTGDGFPGITLQGQVLHIGQQAVMNEGGSAPAFPVQIRVARLTEQQRKIIHIGMSAKIALEVVGPSLIQIPINAVSLDNGQSTVKVFDRKTRAIHIVPVVTGATSLYKVVIQQGLQPGDEVVVSGSYH